MHDPLHPDLPSADDAGPPMGLVVVNYASARLIEANLRPVPLHNARVVLVDNFSDVDERHRVRALAAGAGWNLVERPTNLGFGPAVNAGVRAAATLGCTCVLLLNPDAVVTADTVEALRQACLGDPSALVAPRLLDVRGNVDSAGSTLNLVDGRIRGLRAALAQPDPASRPVTWLTAACLAVSLDLWARAGGFDEHFFMYWEDVDFTFRTLAQGGHVVLRSDLTAVHDQGGTQGPRTGRAKSALYYFYNARNRMVFGARHLGLRDLLRWWALAPRVSWEILMQGGRRQLLRQPGLAWSALSGGISGMRLATPQIMRLLWLRVRADPAGGAVADTDI